jgi:CRISPR-associated endonuclease Cas2
MKIPKKVSCYVVIYDIFSNKNNSWISSSERRRAKIARILLEHGIRTQKSMYELTISPSKLEKIISLLSTIIDKNDRIYIYPIENRLIKKIARYGKEVDIMKNIFI